MMAIEMEVSSIKKMEMTYGVVIAEDALPSALHILQACGNDPNLGNDIDAVQLVERGCQKLRKSLDLDDEESKLDWDEYCLDRSLVELVELRKEKFVDSRSDFLPSIAERDYSEMRSKWECFSKEWAPLLTRMRENSNKRVVSLRSLRSDMLCFMKNNETKLEHDQLLRSFTTANTHLHRTIPSAFQQRRLVTPSLVAEVASSMTGLFLRYFESPFYRRTPPHEQLKSRSLSEKLVILDEAIHKIACALSKRNCKMKSIFGSFLFLGSHGRGRKRLARALAEEIYDDKDRFLIIDMSEYNEPSHVSRLIKLLHGNKKRGSVVMFENIENGGHCSIELVSHILRDGRVRDDVDFSHDLILVSSHIGHESFSSCTCLKSVYKLPFQQILKEAVLLDPPKHYNNCYLRPFYAKVTDLFDVKFMDLFDDVVVFPWVRPQDMKGMARLHMREVATSMSTPLEKKVFFYPSLAALTNIYVTVFWASVQKGVHSYMTWYEDRMVPLLNDDIIIRNNKDETTLIIYIDVILGFDTSEFSLRVETGRHLEKYLDYKSFKQDLWKLRKIYRREKLLVNKIYMLQKSYLELLELNDVSSVMALSKQVIKLIDDILIFDIIETQLMHVDEFDGNIKLIKTARLAKSYVKNNISTSDKATQVVVRSLVSNGIKRESSCPTSFLCLGLTSLVKESFTKSLAQHLVMDDGENLMSEVDLSKCTEPGSFLRYACDVNKIPHSVIVLLKLEAAPISIFSKILCILEFGVAEDEEGNEVYFGDSVVVIISDAGNKEMMGGLNGRHCYYMVLRNQPVHEIQVTPPEQEMQEFIRGTRCELLNLLDYILVFDPISDDQLNAFAKLSMKSLERKIMHTPFLYLFRLEGDQRCKRGIPYDTGNLVDDIRSAGGKGEIVRYSPPGLKIPPNYRYIHVPY